jgi:hypothetical protein
MPRRKQNLKAASETTSQVAGSHKPTFNATPRDARGASCNQFTSMLIDIVLVA